MSTDSNGNIYFAGSTDSSITNDGMVVKLNASGARVWSKRIASSAVLARSPTQIYVASYPFLRRLNGTTGTTVWAK